MNKLISFSVISIIFLSNLAFSENMPLGIFVSGEDSATATPSQGLSVATGGKFILRLHTKCYGTNLRGVANPISPSSMIKANFDMNVSGQNINFFVNFPGSITTKVGMKAATIKPMQQSGTITYTVPGGTTTVCTPIAAVSNFFGILGGGGFGILGGGGGGTSCQVVALPPIIKTEAFINHNLPNGSVAGIYGNTVQMYINSTTGLTRNPDGSASTSPVPATLNSYSFSQKVMDCLGTGAVYGSVGYSTYTPSYACGAYMAKDGPTSGSVSGFKLASDNSSADVTVSFPGQTGFCGGYFSPLMVFMDEERPLFANVSDFPLNPAGQTSWVEENSPGYFLVYDEKLNGKIETKDQLFGDNDKFKNGFDNLAQFDLNKDNFINKKDKVFKKLFLWNDKNANGISEKNELVALGKKVTKISLKYNPSNVRPIGKFAEERESSKFYYLKNNKEIAADIIDVWLSPQPSRKLAAETNH